jgi:hypothetical protein
MWSEALLICYFLGLVAALLKTVRYALDVKRTHQAFYWIGVPANLALASALLSLAASAGDTFNSDFLRFSIRLSFITWAVLAVIFEMLYLRTFVNVTKVDEDENEVSNG